MTELEKLIDAFQKLSFEDKKKRLISSLALLKGVRSTFDEVLNVVENNPNIDDEFLTSCYTAIMSAGDHSKNAQKNEKIDQVANKLKESMKRLHDKEEAERLQENPDDLLKAI